MSYVHGRQSTPSSAPEVNPPDRLLSIGELARRAGVTTSALRYYEELGTGPAAPQDITQCPNFNAGLTARLAGQPLSHQELHGSRFHEMP